MKLRIQKLINLKQTIYAVPKQNQIFKKKSKKSKDKQFAKHNIKTKSKKYKG